MNRNLVGPLARSFRGSRKPALPQSASSFGEGVGHDSELSPDSVCTGEYRLSPLLDYFLSFRPQIRLQLGRRLTSLDRIMGESQPIQTPLLRGRDFADADDMQAPRLKLRS